MSRAHGDSSAGMGMLASAPGFSSNCDGRSSALRAGHGSPSPGTGGWHRTASTPLTPPVSLGWSHQLSRGVWLSTLRHGWGQPLSWVPGSSCHPPCPLCWCQRQQERQNRSLRAGTEDSHGTGAPHLCRAETARDGAGGLAFLLRWLALTISRAETPRCHQAQPGTKRASSGVLRSLPPRLSWHGPANTASVIGSCVCGQGVMKRFSVSLCKLP